VLADHDSVRLLFLFLIQVGLPAIGTIVTSSSMTSEQGLFAILDTSPATLCVALLVHGSGLLVPGILEPWFLFSY
jgi:hypothetical protein